MFLLLQQFLEDILVVLFKGKQAVETFIWVQGGLAPPDQVIINSGEDLLSRSFKGWSKSHQRFRQLLCQISWVKVGSGLR